MSLPIAPATQAFPLSPPSQASESQAARRTGMNWGDSALTAPETPSNRVPSVDRSKVRDPRKIQAAEELESVFIDQLMQEMRKTVPKEDMDMDNAASEIYRGMLDSEYAQKAAHTGGVGLADVIIAYLAPESYTLKSGTKSVPNGKDALTGEAPRRTGGMK